MPRILFLWIFLLFGLPLSAQNGTLRIGTNLAGPSDWGAEWPFADIMKYSRRWITFNAEWVEGGENPWDTGVLDRIPVDEHGYPLELPVPVEGTETAQVVRTVWHNTTLKEGIYTVLYDGEGRIAIGFDGTVLTESPGRITFDYLRRDGILALMILESKKSDPVRNIRVLLPGTDEAEGRDPWSAEWLEKLEPFGTLRFMDWGLTNNSRLKTWEDRPHVDDYTYTIRGVPYEWMIALCNRKQAGCWVCVPHDAEDEYIRQMARLFRDGLDPSLKIYVEYSNEIWNWMFDQTHALYENGEQDMPWPERIVPFIQNAMDIWTEEFAGRLDRLVRVAGVQAAWQDVSNRIVFNLRPGSIDAFSPAAYFGLSDEGYAALERLGGAASAEDVLFWAREGMRNDSFPWMKAQDREISRRLGLPMIYYEGGQHLTPDPFGSDQPYGRALMDAQTHPGMYDLYTEWFDSLRTLIPESESALLMNFSFIGQKNGQYGSWGVLESQFGQFPPYRESAPKYQAILDALTEPSAAGTRESGPAGLILDPVFPNPFNGPATVVLALRRPERVDLSVFDARGRRVQTLREGWIKAGRHTFVWDPAGAPSGVYFIRLVTAGGTVTRPCVLMK
ncbi:MAG TPA: T9SS type A sorting domain-containing protein [bacterium]|nr:T9SS type A sorting domain-containing protein [bacterium]